MTTGSEPNDLDREVDASMRMFERSKVGTAAAITAVQPSRVLLVLDGSDQDETGTDAAAYLRAEFNTETLVLDASDKDSAHGTDGAVERAGQVTGARPIKRKEGDAYDSILAALDDHAVDLVILPCPFGRSFEKVGADSAGTVIDVMLSRCPVPMLVIRRNDQRLADCVANVSMVLGNECESETRAAAWAFGLAGPTATVTLNLVIEREQYENVRSIIEAIDPQASLNPEQFSEALTKAHHSIHAAMAKTASALGLTYQLRPVAGEAAPPNPLEDSNRMLLVLPLEVDDRYEHGFVQDRLRHSPHPVLIVPGHLSK